MNNENSKPWRLMIVDDADSILTLVEKIAGMVPQLEISKCHSAEEAFAVAKLQAPDVVISDLVMPGMGGKWLLDQLRQARIVCPFIVLSGCSDAKIMIELFQAGAYRYITKPARVSVIYQALLDALPSPVYFEYKAASGSRVFVAGDFNGWNAGQYQLVENPEPGHFACRIPISRGQHEYKFIVNDEWVCDPACQKKCRNSWGIENSVLEVQAPTTSPLQHGITIP